MPTDARANWQRFQAEIQNPSATGLRAGPASAPDGGTTIDLVALVAQRGLQSDASSPVRVPEGGAVQRAVVAALAALPEGIPLSTVVITGADREAFQAVTTLLKHGLVSEASIAAGTHDALNANDRATTGLLPHALAALGADFAAHEPEAEPTGFNPLSLQERFELLRAAGLDPAREDENGYTAAHHAAANGNADTLAALSAIGENLHQPNSAGQTPLHVAAANRDQRGLDYLLADRQAIQAHPHDPTGSLAGWLPHEVGSINRPDHQGRTPLHHLLVHRGGEVHSHAFAGTLAALRGAGGDLARRDQSTGLNVNDVQLPAWLPPSQPVTGRTPLEAAVVEGGAESIRAIEAAGLLNEADRLACFKLALRAGNPEAAAELFRGAGDALKHRIVVEVAADRRCSVQALASLPGVDLDVVDAEGRTPVQSLLKEWNEAMLTHAFYTTSTLQPFSAALRLIRQGATLPEAEHGPLVSQALNFDARRDARAHSALKLMTRNGVLTQPHPEVARQVGVWLDLIENGNAAGARKFQSRHLRNILESGAMPAQADRARVVQVFAQVGDSEALSQLNRVAFNLEQVGADGRTALQSAAATGDLGAVKTLIRAGATVNQTGADGNTALHLAARGGHADIIRALKNSGADLRLTNAQGERAADLAADRPTRSLLSGGVLRRLFRIS